MHVSNFFEIPCAGDACLEFLRNSLPDVVWPAARSAGAFDMKHIWSQRETRNSLRLKCVSIERAGQ